MAAHRTLLLLLCIAGCAACPRPPPEQPPQTCVPSTEGLERIDTAGLAVHIDGAESGVLAPVRGDVARSLGELAGSPVTVSTAAPDDSKPFTLWMSTSGAAAETAGVSITEGYALRRVEKNGRVVFVVYATDEKTLAHAAYAFLEVLGVRFFHPRETYVPATGGLYLPRSLHVTRHSRFRVRGVQEHTLHPIEYLLPFNAPGEANLSTAREYVDWLAHTGQNHVQWPLMDTVDFAAFRPHAAAIIEHAHRRGVTVGAVVQVFARSSLQNNYVLVEDESPWQGQLEAALDNLMTVPWDHVELALGEFVGGDPELVVSWLSHATAYLKAAHPDIEVFVPNHVGNYDGMWVSYRGRETFFYQLGQYADQRLGQNVHTVFFFDLYRDWGTYSHPNFHLQREYIMAQLPHRKVRYHPESAYWIAADVDVPIFLAEYLHSRWLDIHGLDADITAAGLPRLDGHIMFSSGKEWMYWLTDYLAARMLWEPEQDLRHFLRHYGGVFGTCEPAMTEALARFVDLQSTWLFDGKLIGYLSGEDAVVDIGYVSEHETHPHRVPLEDVMAMDEPALQVFERDVVGGLAALAAESRPVEATVDEHCPRMDAAMRPWCDELRDGIRIVRIRAEHMVALYRALIDSKRGGHEVDAFIAAARARREEAAGVIAGREAHYRFDGARLVDEYENPTIYKFGYLRQAHTLCFWRRPEQQLDHLLVNGLPADIFALPTCNN